MTTEGHTIDQLFATIQSRRRADPTQSYTAKLFARGVGQCAKKLGEEGVEAAIAAVQGDPKAVIAESADLLYHLLVVWEATEVTPADVYAELRRREGLSGIEEKARRHT
jgi:phosphoribosyl-ATP pyrophosphohydrolase